jgi:hypothetical protein
MCDRLEMRLADLQMEVDRLRGKIETTEVFGEHWWEHISGTFANNPIYEEAMLLGRSFLESRRPRHRKRKTRRKGRSGQ